MRFPWLIFRDTLSNILLHNRAAYASIYCPRLTKNYLALPHKAKFLEIPFLWAKLLSFSLAHTILDSLSLQLFPQKKK